MQTSPSTEWHRSGTIVVIGHHGMLGSEWSRYLGELVEQDRLVLLDVDTCDLTGPHTASQMIPASAAVVINCAAYTDVDGAESNETLATEINGHAVGRLSMRCREIDALLVQYSTDYVFEGNATAPYPTLTLRNPSNAYGRGKALGEELLLESGCASLIIRTSWLYAAHGKNFVRTIAKLCLERESLLVVDDQRGRPAWAGQLVRTTAGLLGAGSRGVFHATDGGECSWYEFAREIVARVNPSCRVEPCTSEQFPRAAARPPYSVLDIQETEQIVGTIPHWREALGIVLTTMQADKPGSVGS